MKYPKLIGICGKAQSGKDTTADYLDVKYNFYKCTFAWKVKDIAKRLFNVSPNTTKTDKLPEWGITYRNILQQIGSKMREIHPNVWIKFLLGDLNREISNWIFYGSTISDVRYVNEYNAIREMGGKMIRIIRTNYESNLTAFEQFHPSETELDSIPDSGMDLVITAKSGDLQKIYDEIDKWIELLNYWNVDEHLTSEQAKLYHKFERGEKID